MDSDFYLKYANYLVEPRVRIVHDQMFSLLTSNHVFDRVLDLGCGKSNEYFYHRKPIFYVGIDLNPLLLTWDLEPGTDPNRIKGYSIRGDYRKIQDKIKSTIEIHRLTAIVSLFSVENTAPPDVNDAFYQELFEQTSISSILTSGFYYRGNETDLTIEEDGVLAYQTPSAMSPENSIFSEIRSLVACPSKMFGEKPIEVWRLLTRK
jgi:hypothetical protein